MKRFIAIVSLMLMMGARSVLAQANNSAQPLTLIPTLAHARAVAQTNPPPQSQKPSQAHILTATCTLQCCDECFPYLFCHPNGTQYVQCSKNPNSEYDPPAKSFIPSCVEVDGMRPEGLYQPNSSPPTPQPYLGNDYFDPTFLNTAILFAEESGAGQQQMLDSELFEEGQPPVEPPASDPSFFTVTTNPGDAPDSTDYTTIDDPDDHISDYAITPYDYDPDPPQDNPDYITDSTTYADEMSEYDSAYYAWETDPDEQNYYAYLGGEAQYQADLNAWVKNQNSYMQIWNQTQADSDASQALQHWLNQCSPPIPPTGIVGGCCLHIIMDSSARDFQATGGDPTRVWAQTVDLTLSPGTPTCDDTKCPYFSRFIEVNESNAMFYQSNNPTEQHPDSNYILHSVPQMGFYTSQTTLPDVYSGYSSMSFYTLMEHEIGHFLGMLHPDEPDDNGDTCHNCYTQNPAWTTDSLGISIFHTNGYETVMQPILLNGQPPMQLSDEDVCQFQKLYCQPACGGGSGACGTDGVTKSNATQDWFNPEVFPNPSNGGMTLNYDVQDRSLVQVTIYDILGNAIRGVSSGYVDPGPKSISLGTESLPAGQYVCRVRVGDNVAYINLVIKK